MRIAVCLILTFHLSTAAQELRFEKVDQGVILNNDQQSIIDLHIYNGIAYSLQQRWSVHSFWRSVSFYRIGIDGLLKNPDDYYSVNPFPGLYQSLFSLVYQNDLYYIDDELRLQDRIVRIGDTLHLPDHDDHSHRFALDGTSLGRAPGFAELERQASRIRVADEPVEFPFTLSGDEYSSVIELETVAILLNDRKYAVVGYDDLNQNGANVSAQIFPREYVFDERRDRWRQQTRIRPLAGDYFLVRNSERNSMQAFLAEPRLLVREIPIADHPNQPHMEWSQVENGIYYQIESAGWFLLTLVEYKLSGIGQQSAAEESWEDYN